MPCSAVTCRVLIMKAFAGREVSWWMYFQELFFLNFDWEMMTYWAVVGLSHALDFHRESQERELTAAQLQTRLAEANLQALQRQLHPHFLFNTLQHDLGADASRYGGRRRHARAARRSAAADARSRRHAACLAEGRARLPRKYLEIEKTRFGERLQVHIDVDPDTLDAAVPNLVLQPLVENALRHGIGPKIGGGRVDIIARRDGQRPAGSRCATTASASPTRDAFQQGRRPDATRGRVSSTCTATAIASSATRRPAAGCS